jgi:hypothetical protein
MLAGLGQSAWAMQETRTPEVIALERIEAAAQDGREYVDLSALELTSVPNGFASRSRT